jgi:hypothetical protein
MILPLVSKPRHRTILRILRSSFASEKLSLDESEDEHIIRIKYKTACITPKKNKYINK